VAIGEIGGGRLDQLGRVFKIQTQPRQHEMLGGQL
jgi:hypothetical protein